MSFQLRSDIHFGTFLVHYTHELDADLPILNHTNEKQIHLTKVLGIQGGSSLQGVVRSGNFKKKKLRHCYSQFRTSFLSLLIG